MSPGQLSGYVYDFYGMVLPHFRDLLPESQPPRWESSPLWPIIKKRLRRKLGPSKRLGQDGYDSHLAIFEQMGFEPRYTHAEYQSKKPLRIGLRCESVTLIVHELMALTPDRKWNSADQLLEIVNAAVASLVVAELDFRYLVFSQGKKVNSAAGRYMSITVKTKWNTVHQAEKHLADLETNLRDLEIPCREALMNVRRSLRKVNPVESEHSVLRFLHPRG